MRGFLFSILRKNRVRVTYRYGGEEYAGDTTIPEDIKDCVIKMTAIDILNTSFRMDQLPTGGITSPSESKKYWQEDLGKAHTAETYVNKNPTEIKKPTITVRDVKIERPDELPSDWTIRS